MDDRGGERTLGLFSPVTAFDGYRPTATIADGGAVLARALTAAAGSDVAVPAIVDAVVRTGRLEDDDLAAAQRLLARMGGPAVARLLAYSGADYWQVDTDAWPPSKTAALEAWPRVIDPSEVEAPFFEDAARNVALGLLSLEGRLVGGAVKVSKCAPDGPRAAVLHWLAALLGCRVEEEAAEESFIRFRVGGAVRKLWVPASEDEFWFPYDFFVEIARSLGTHEGRRLYTAADGIGAIVATSDEAKRLRIEWDVPIDEAWG